MHKIIAPLIISMLPFMVHASDLNEPFDFGYTVDGQNNRPLTVFNDGDTTFIQGRAKQQLFFNGVNTSMRGPYYVVQGVPDTIEGFSGGEAFKIVWQGAKKSSINNEAGRINGDLKQKTFSGTFGRIAFINGVPPDVGLVNALPKNLQLREAMKALAPHGWSGSSDRSINTTQTINIDSAAGDSWITVMDRMMTTLNIWLEIDSAKANLYLRDAPPKGFSVVLDSTSQLRQPVAANSGDPVPGLSVPSVAQAVPDQNDLLSSVNVRRIEQSNGRVTVLVMNGKRPMRFVNLDTGVPVTAKSEGELSYTLPLFDVVRIQTETGGSIDVKRVFKHTANFNQVNPLGLKQVVASDNATVFTFARALPQIRIASSLSENVAGTWNQNTYTVPGLSAEWKVVTPQSAVQVEMVDSAIFLWRQSTDPMVSAQAN